MSRYDVLIFERSSRTIDTIVGSGLPMEHPYESALRRYSTVLPRLNTRYGVAIVEAGPYSEGSPMPKRSLLESEPENDG